MQFAITANIKLKKLEKMERTQGQMNIIKLKLII